MAEFHRDIFTESSDIDVDTLRDLGSLTGMAGIWEGIGPRGMRRASSYPPGAAKPAMASARFLSSRTRSAPWRFESR